MLFRLSLDDKSLPSKHDGWIKEMENDLQNSFLSNLIVLVKRKMEKTGEIKRLSSNSQAILLLVLKIGRCSVNISESVRKEVKISI